jgi:hypothetical protein
MRALLTGILFAVLMMSCRAADGDGTDAGPADAAAESWWHGGNGDAVGSDPDLGEDAAAPVDLHGDVPEPNTAPTFNAIPPQTLDMGTSVVIDFNPLLQDAEDDDSMLVLSWSGDHVALQDPGDHLVLVVAPVDWHGSEVIDITVTDSGGLTAMAPLKVIVEEVEVPEPPPPDKCGETPFALDAGTETGQVLLSGSFNEWADSVQSGAAALADDDADGTWEVTLTLNPGKHLYKFIVDGDWIHDPANPNKEDDGYGGFNSIIEVAPCEE